MNGRIALMSVTLLSLVACAFPQASYAQTRPLIGTWKLNLEKSKYAPGAAAPRSSTITYQPDGQNIKATQQTIDAQGNAITLVSMQIYDGLPHPVTGSPIYDATAYLRFAGNTIVFSRTKAGKLVATGTSVVSQDGNTLTTTLMGGINENVQLFNVIQVYDKQ